MDDKKKKGIILAVTVVSFVVLSAFVGNATFTSIQISVLAIIAVTILILLFIPIIFIVTKVKSLTDVTGEPVSVVRLNVTRAVVVVIGILVTIMQGDTGFYNLLPFWAAIGGIIGWNYYELVKNYVKQRISY